MPGRFDRPLISPIIYLLLLLPVFLLACAPDAPLRVTEIVRIEITATPPPPSSTPAPTRTRTPTPTPTATAPPIQVTGDPYQQAFADPVPASGAYCGYVDTFDFPLNPPDADGVRGGQDFGVFRNRYGKYHAGEDWGFRGGAAFGEPVYAIGHGTITFADGLGWGPDQGVVIIRHYFPDGSTVLSFYGHLDPPSVTLVPGACIKRGEQVGQIGRPRTSPHLHFEIRTTMPFVAGPGYWEEDPRLAGWLPPSAFIADYRMAKIPGTRWVRSDLETDLLLGGFGTETFVVLEGRRLLGLYAPAGGVRWVHELDGNPAAAAISGEMIYVLFVGGGLQAFRAPGDGDSPPDGAALMPAWQLDSGPARQTGLIPAPWGGIVLAGPNEITAFSPAGIVNWRVDVPGLLSDWSAGGEFLAVSFAGDFAGLHIYGEAGLVRQMDADPGVPVLANEGLYLLQKDALGLALPGESAFREIIQLPEGLQIGEIVGVSTGGVLVLHADRADQRLLFVRDGALVWERSLAGKVQPGARLVSDGQSIYLLAHESNSNSEEIHLFRIAIDSRSLEKVFTGGTRLPSPSRLDAIGVGENGLLIRFGEGSLVSFGGGQAP